MREPVLDPSANTRMRQRPRGREVGTEQSSLSASSCLPPKVASWYAHGRDEARGSQRLAICLPKLTAAPSFVQTAKHHRALRLQQEFRNHPLPHLCSPQGTRPCRVHRVCSQQGPVHGWRPRSLRIGQRAEVECRAG